MLFKDHFNADYLSRLQKRLIALSPSVSPHYLAEVEKLLPSLEMRDRVNNVADAIYNSLKGHKPAAMGEILIKLAHQNREDWREFGVWPIITVFERHFIDDFDDAMAGFYAITPLFTAEFAIRPFIFHYPEKVFKKLEIWATDSNESVRRLASEGIRTKLPWGGKIAYLDENPQKILHILEKLKDDDSLFVRRSVANNLNDLSKDYPQLVLKSLQNWRNDSPAYQWLSKHALRSLIKQGNPQALALIGMDINFNVAATDFSLSSPHITLGESLGLSLCLQNNENKEVKLVLDYVIHHMKANGQTSPKIFKWKNITLKANQRLSLQKQHKIYPITTRRYYAGQHKLEVILNGKTIAAKGFMLSLS